jgi:site-specific recombinase XerD
MGIQKAKYKELLSDPDVQRWYKNLSRGSQVTADVYLRRLGWFCEENRLTPKEIATMAEKDLENLLLDSVSELEEKGKAGSYIESIVKVVKSWLSYNHRELKIKIKIKGADETPTLKEERVPTKAELLKILFAGDKKARAAVALVAFAGLRLEALGNYNGTDGLRIRDLPEMCIVGKRVKFDRVPTMVVVREELSKGGHRYFTFLGDEGCEYLREYLEDRIRKRENFTPDSPVITPKLRMKPFIRTVNIGDTIRKTIRKAGFKWRPYVLRAYFATQLMVAENARKVIRDYRQFWMGHKGDIEAKYHE